ncbi:MAG: hypothetical protein OER90_18490, partial [Gemmatimonadota bacterium]|nr:hypothetical protein [Gemmatimonadota bacterium]
MTRLRRRHRRGLAGLTLVCLAMLPACKDVAPAFLIEGTGDIEGLAFFDANEDGLFDPSDGDYTISDVGITIQDRGTGQTFANGTATSGADGRYLVTGIPAGTHDLVIDTTTVPAGVAICENPLLVSVYIDQAAFEQVAGRPGCLITIQAAKDANLGDFVIVRGLVTSAPGQIEASFAYIEDATAGIFLFAPALMGQGIEVGDQIEVGGNTVIFSGQFELTSVVLRQVVADVATPVPLLVTTAQISASGGDPLDDLQNRFVRIEKAQLLEAFAASGNSQNSSVDDGSGTIVIRVDDGVANRNDLDNIFTVGTCYNINGFA